MSKRNLVNWQDNMKITSAHFIQTENFFIDKLTDNRAIYLQKNDFGLLPLKDSTQEIGIQIREHLSNNVEVTLYKCNAITSSGERIAFNPGIHEAPLSKIYSANEDLRKGDSQNKTWNVMLTVDSYARIATGEIDPSEDPPRYPDCEPLYKLQVVPSEQLDASTMNSHFLIIGKIRRQGDRYIVDSNYIPPCRNMSSHPELINYFRRFDTMIYSLRRSSMNIITKVNDKTNGSDLTINIRSISKEILQYLMSINFSLKNFGADIHPVIMAEYVCTLASQCYASLLCLPGIQKDELLKYFFEWSDVTPGSFDELLGATTEIQYDHHNIRSVMVKLESFLATLTELWERLSHLEYIGYHKESLVVSVSGGNNLTEERRGFMVSD